MHPAGQLQYCCYYHDGGICLGLVCGKEEGRLCLSDGKKLVQARVLFQWSGGNEGSGESKDTVGLEQQQAKWQDLLGGQLSLVEEKVLEELRNDFEAGELVEQERLLAGLLSLSDKHDLSVTDKRDLSVADKRDGWQQARWFWVLHAGVCFQRRVDGWQALSVAEGQQLRCKKELVAEQKMWLAEVRTWCACLDESLPLPAKALDNNTSKRGVADIDTSFSPPDFLTALRSLLVAEKASPYWRLVASGLGLVGMEKFKRQKLLAGWLQKAGRWAGWHDIWLEQAGAGNFSAEMQALAESLAETEPSGNSHQTPVLSKKQHFPNVTALSLDSYTFDAPSTRDYDDAIAIEKASSNAVVVVVSIAAPAVLITATHPLMEDALGRASSLYHPAGCVPMLPLSISEGRSSLKAGCWREALNFRLELSFNEARLLDIFPSWVKVRENCDYQQGTTMLNKQDSWGLLANICQHLAQKRLDAGALLQNRQELHLVATNPQAVKISRVERDAPIYRLVEELAISCNARAADYCHQEKLAVCYRVQKSQTKLKVRESKSDSHATKQNKYSKTLRSLSVAKYKSDASPHAGLACQRYLQLTAPLRRGLDLCIQQQLLAHFAASPLPWQREQLEEIAENAEQRLKILLQVRRQLEKYWKLVWLEQNNQPLLAEHHKPATNGDARVWLPQLDLAVRLKGALSEGKQINVRVLEVDKHKLVAWVAQQN